jgi:hypothetical protein
MTYNLKLDEREFELILKSLVNGENFDIIKPVPSKYDNDAVSIDFRNMLEYGNAYLVKCCLCDEERDYQKLNCETHIEQCKKNAGWAEDYETCDYGIRKKSFQ